MQALLFLVAFGVFTRTLCPTVSFDDAGEICVGALGLGVLHPPGYPLFSILSALWVHVPLGSIALRLNVFSAALGAATSAVLWMLWRRMRPEDNRFGAAAALLAVLSASFWSQATLAKGGFYTLNALFTAGIIACLFAPERGKRASLFASLMFGLALAHHWMSVAGLLPGVIWLAARGNPEERVRKVFFALATAAIGASLYLYMPLRAAADPFLNWGNPDSLGRLLFMLGRRQYLGSLPDTVMAGPWEKLGYASGALDSAAPWFLLLALAALGFRSLLKDRPAQSMLVLVYAASVWAGLLLVPIRRGTPWFLEIYSMPVTLVLVLFAAVGLKDSVGRFRGGASAAVLVAALWFAVVVPGRWFSADRSREYLTWDLAVNIEASARKGGLLFANSDAVVFGNWHRRFVEGPAEGLVCIPAPLLPMRWVGFSLARLLPDSRVPAPPPGAGGEIVPAMMKTWVSANRSRYDFYAFLTEATKAAFGRRNMGAEGLIFRIADGADEKPPERFVLGRLRFRGVIGSETAREARKEEAIRPIYFGGLLDYGNRMLRSDPGKAELVFRRTERVAGSDSDRALAQLGLGNAAVARGDTRSAILIYEAAFRLDRTLATALRNKAMLLLRDKRNAEALETMRKVKEEAPFSEEAAELEPLIRRLEKSLDFR